MARFEMIGRVRNLLAWRRRQPAERVLALMVLAGVALRVFAQASWWPAGTVLSDAGDYAYYAGTNPLASPQHSPGYSLVLAVIGFFSRNVLLTIFLQYLVGIASALLMYVAVRRMTRSPWPGLLPAGVILLNADEVFLEHTIMSEAWFVLALAATLYAAVKAIDAPAPWWRWPAGTAVLAVVATIIRANSLFLLPVITVAVLLAMPRPRRDRWRAAAAVLSVGVLLVLGFAYVNKLSSGRFEIAPAQGWHLYGRVAPFADCHQFVPPKGTAGLCQTTPPSQRPAGPVYLYYPVSPAWQLWGPNPWKHHDADMRAWAIQVILAQPGTYLKTMLRDLASWYVPSLRSRRFLADGNLDPELDWGLTAHGSAALFAAVIEPAVGKRLRTFFSPFSVHKWDGGLIFLHDYQRAFRFGGTALSITTLLCLIGFIIGTRRNRIGVLLFGVGGLSLLAAPLLSVWYVGRYSEPLAGPIAAGAAIGLQALWDVWRSRRGSKRARDLAAALTA